MSGKISLVWAGALTVLPHLALAADSAGPPSAPARRRDRRARRFPPDREHRKHLPRCAVGGSARIQESRLSVLPSR